MKRLITTLLVGTFLCLAGFAQDFKNGTASGGFWCMKEGIASGFGEWSFSLHNDSDGFVLRDCINMGGYGRTNGESGGCIFGSNGAYTPVAQLLITKCGSEILAAWVMFILSGFIGGICSASALLFENDKLNLILQTLLHCIINAPSMFLIGWICYWMPHTAFGITVWFSEFIVIYIMIWLSFYLSYKKQTKQINEALANK